MSPRFSSSILVWTLVLSGLANAQQFVSVRRHDGQAVVLAAYQPKTEICRGVAVISHGAGGSEKGYAYLGELLASLGYHAVVPGHLQSGPRALRDLMQGRGLAAALAALVVDPDAYRGRFMDIAAARHWARASCPGQASILVGHSMGAATVMLEAGAHNQLGLTGDATFDAYVALSPQGSGPIFPPGAWSGMRRPLLMITGTRDDELGGKPWQARTESYANLPTGCKWMGVIDGATHMHLAGRGLPSQTETLIAQLITAFLAGGERGDCRAPPALTGVDLRSK
jgi:dienelactone hydrolase